METDQKYIRIHFFEGFKGEDSILISVDVHGLLELEEVFLKLSEGLEEYDFRDLKLLDRDFPIRVKAFSSVDNSGFRKAADETYEWKVTKEKWNEYREMVTVMYKNYTDGHQYLDSDSDDLNDLQVVLSWNEYSKDFWDEFGHNNKKE